MAKKINTPLTNNRFGARLYVCLCMDAMMKLMKGGDKDAKIIELIVPLLEELYEDSEIFA
jgi:hypothetical protein